MYSLFGLAVAIGYTGLYMYFIILYLFVCIYIEIQFKIFLSTSNFYSPSHVPQMQCGCYLQYLDKLTQWNSIVKQLNNFRCNFNARDAVVVVVAIKCTCSNMQHLDNICTWDLNHLAAIFKYTKHKARCIMKYKVDWLGLQHLISPGNRETQNVI